MCKVKYMLVGYLSIRPRIFVLSLCVLWIAVLHNILNHDMFNYFLVTTNRRASVELLNTRVQRFYLKTKHRLLDVTRGVESIDERSAAAVSYTTYQVPKVCVQANPTEQSWRVRHARLTIYNNNNVVNSYLCIACTYVYIYMYIYTHTNIGKSYINIHTRAGRKTRKVTASTTTTTTTTRRSDVSHVQGVPADLL